MGFVQELLYNAWKIYHKINPPELPVTITLPIMDVEFEITFVGEGLFTAKAPNNFSKNYDARELWRNLFYYDPHYQHIVGSYEQALRILFTEIISDYYKWLKIKKQERAYKGTECYTNE